MKSKHRLLHGFFCNACGKPIQSLRACDLKRGRGRFCSLHCSRKVAGLRSIPANSNPLRKIISQVPRNRKLQILCVCRGNQNRSPAIEAILNHYLKMTGLDSRVQVDSGGVVIPAGEVWSNVNHSLAQLLEDDGIGCSQPLPFGVTDDQLRKSHLVLTADNECQEIVLERLKGLYPQRHQVHQKSILFASLDPKRFGGTFNVTDPQNDYPMEKLIRDVKAVVRRKIIPVIKSALGCKNVGV